MQAIQELHATRTPASSGRFILGSVRPQHSRSTQKQPEGQTETTHLSPNAARMHLIENLRLVYSRPRSLRGAACSQLTGRLPFAIPSTIVVGHHTAAHHPAGHHPLVMETLVVSVQGSWYWRSEYPGTCSRRNASWATTERHPDHRNIAFP